MSVEIEGLNEFTKEMVEICSKEYPKQVKKMLQKSGNKLRKKVVSKARTKVKKKTGNYIKGFKRGKIIYSYGDVKYNIRVYNNSNHAHLIEDGHVQWSGGKQVGFTKGKHVLEKASKLFEEEFEKHTEEFIEKTVEDGLHF